MADPAFPGFLPGAPDSADPKAILRDLQQLSVVAQRLGIDLQKTAAMGQTVAGQKGNTPTSIRETHQANMLGGGTGYANMASGQIAGSVMFGSLPKMVQDYKKWKDAGFPEGFGGQSAKNAARHRMKHGLASDADRATLGITTPGTGGPGIPGGPKPSWKPSSTDFGQAASRKFNQQFTTVYGMYQLYGALTNPVNVYAGETRRSKIADAAVMTGKGLVLAETASAIMAAKGIYSKSRATGASRSLSAGRAAGASVGTASALAAATLAIMVIESGIELAKIERKTSYDLAEAKNGWNPEIRPPKDGSVTAIKPVSHEANIAFLKAVEEGRADYYIDPITKKRTKRSFLGKRWQNFPVLRHWNLAKLQKEEIEWRLREANRLHESATKKGEVMDWQGAIEDTQKAKEMIVAEEAMPFFWKQPEKFLRAMESSRIAGRNWARSQQPRGASRTGD
jgi:hypothetical protein